MRELEDVTLSSLEDSDISAASTYATIVIALRRRRVAIPRRLPRADRRSSSARQSIHVAYVVGVGIAFVELFLLGLFLGRVSRQRLVWSGVKLVAAGVLCTRP